MQESLLSDAGPTRYSKPCKAAIEGLVEGEQDPPYLYMHSNHSAQRLEDNRISSSYDIDSLCSFPTSLGVARLGIQWYTQSHITLNLVDNIHLSIEIPGTHKQDGTVTTQPLYTIPNYCLGRVIGLADMFIWAFFPALFSGKLSDPYSQTCIPKKNFVHYISQRHMPSHLQTAMRPTFKSALAEWQHHWNSAVNKAYIDPEVTYIDIGRQMTPADTGPHRRMLIWRRCCMDRLWRRRLQWSRIQNRLYHREEDACKDESGKHQAPPIRRTTYPFITLRDTRDITITPSSSSWELRNGLVYSQFYNLIKVPFDAAKQYPFQNRHTESMALDPSYLRDQRNSTRGAHAHQSQVQYAYRLSKLRIHRNVPAIDQNEDNNVIKLFQQDIWHMALKSISWKTGSDVTDKASMKYPESSPPSFYYDRLSNLFHDRQRDMSHTRPHLIAGNKIRSTSMKDLFDDLFSPSSTGTAMKRRRG
ncbi:hypothetical protein FOXYSP1_14302 [Fusarium oxysporum f. sp. phaseoli]